MQSESVLIAGVCLLKPIPFKDQRGTLVKVYHQASFNHWGLRLQCAELFYSRSPQNVIRGFHFQQPPYSLEKLIWVTEGEILDVVLDLRTASPTYGQCFATRLAQENCHGLYIPQGVAHAFGVLSEFATVLYATSQIYSAPHDAGIRWDSTDFRWPIENPILSDKDRQLPQLDQFDSPF